MPFDPDFKATEYRLGDYHFLEPEKWFCKVWDYDPLSSQLLIGATHFSGEQLSIVFLRALYFQGPFQWRGAAFYVEPIERCEAVLQRMQLHEDLLKTELEVQKLFTVRPLEVNSSDVTAQIMAGLAFVTDRKIREFMS